MTRARRHQRLLSAAAFGLLVLAAEVGGRSLTWRVDRLLHVGDPIATDARYYPFLLLGVKAGVALLAARLAWRFVRAHATARAGRRLLAALGAHPGAAPRVRVGLSARLWAASFGSTALVFLLQTDADHRAATLAPWLHTYALPVFAVLSVLVALGWRAVAGWLSDYESYAEETYLRARRLAAGSDRRPAVRRGEDSLAPRHRFGLAFESRGPPLPA
ncbi:MAG TPA: hypothetical protein VLN26_15170 [Gaiellaceae bacterium]|nr:hypothetical protein [Gaiellaceae bacterium]